MKPNLLCVGVVASLGILFAPQSGTSAELIITGGDIVTVNELQPQAEAVAVNGGRIVAVGYRDEVMKLMEPGAKVIDLGGKTLVPGFIDAHGHVFSCGIQAIAANLFAAPDGNVKDIASLQNTLRQWAKADSTRKFDGWIYGTGYDDSQLKEQRHPNRVDLDAVSKDVPIVVVHQSGHLMALNSKALELAGITAATPDPPGGVIRRKPGTREPDGVLEEAARAMVSKVLPLGGAGKDQMIARAAQDIYFRHGFTTAQEGKSSPSLDAVWASLAEKGDLKIDVVSYPNITLADKAMKSPYAGRQYKNHFRIGGVKLSQDGSPQGKTAWLTKPYFKAPPGRKEDYAGYPALKDEQVIAFVDQAFASGWQILSHVNGDAAADQFIRAVRSAEQKYGKADRRPVAIHAQTVRDDQIAAFQELGIIPSFFTMHTYYWGDWHRRSVLGPERGSNISPTGWAMKRGMIFTSHHDAPVAFPDAIRVLSATVTRVARGSGDVVGPEHCVSPLTGLKSITLWAAYQYFEEKTKGSIEVGKLADFVVLSDNPLKIDPRKIADIKVLETIKAGQSIYRRKSAD